MNLQLYGKHARFDGTGHAMSEDELRAVAPSIFATTAHDSRSERFAPIATIEVLRGLMAEGFFPVGARQSVARDPGRREFTKHLIRLRRLDDTKHQVGDTVAEALLKNANDGSSAYDLMLGLFRIKCLNSLVAEIGTIDAVKIKHTGDVGAKVIEGTYRVLGQAQAALEAPDKWSRIELGGREAMAFAEAARVARFADAEGAVTTPITAAQLLTPRRSDDQGNDLWRTFNVVQENVVKGGLTGIARDARNRPRRTTTRAINGIDQDVKLNKALWTLAARMAEIKGGAAVTA